MEQIHHFKGLSAVVGTVININHFKFVIEQLNRGQDAVAVHAAWV